MPDRRPFRRFSSLALFFFLGLAVSGPLLAQQGNGNEKEKNNGKGKETDPPILPLAEIDSIGPEVYVVPAGGTFYTSSVEVTVYWCDNVDLRASSRLIKFKGVDLTSSFTYESGFSEQCNWFGETKKSVGTINVAAAGLPKFYASIEDYAGHKASATEYFTYDALPSPTVSVAPMNEDYLNTAAQVADGFEAVLSHTTPGFVYKNAARQLTFVYRSGQADPRILVQADIASLGDSVPDYFSLKVLDPDSTEMTFFNNDSTEIYWQGVANDTMRIGGVVDASSLGTGAHDLILIVKSHFGTEIRSTTSSVRVLVVDESSSPYGAGWSLAGLQKAYVQPDGSVMITEGDGSAIYFEKNGSSFARPAGDFSTLVTTTSPSGYKREFPNGTWIQFDSGGKMAEIEDRFGNATTYAYEVNGGVDEITPIGSSMKTTIAYFSSDSLRIKEGKHGQVPYRYTTLRLNGAGQVSSIRGPDESDEASFTYSAGRASSVTDRRGETTDFAYDAFGYLKSTELPQIQANGANVRPKIEQRSLALAIGPDPASGDGTATSPATALYPDSVMVWIENPEDEKTYLAMDRFGAALRIDEPLGRTTLFTRNWDSQVTRVDFPSGAYTTTTWGGPVVVAVYESVKGRTLTYHYASPASSNHYQPTKLYDSESPASLFYYYNSDDLLDTLRLNGPGGQILATYTYESDGRIETRRDAGAHLTEYRYHAVGDFYNLKEVEVHGASESLISEFGYDAFGRLDMTVSAAGDTALTEYDDLDRVAWSTNFAQDTTHFDYDEYLVNGVEDPLGQIYANSHNALGWVTKSFDPKNDSTLVQYDRNGNVIGGTDRLGNTLSLEYDALNLPTLEVVEGDSVELWSAPDGTKAAFENAVSRDTIEYDDAGRVVKQIVRRGSGFSRRYVVETDSEDRGLKTRIQITAPGAIDYDFRAVWDSIGRLEKLSDYVPTTPVHTDVFYDAHSQPDSVKIGGTTRWKYDHSGFHATTVVEHTNSTMDRVFGFKVLLDSLTLRVNRAFFAYGSGVDSARVYQYDHLGQLTWTEDRTTEWYEECDWDYDIGEWCDEPYMEWEDVPGTERTMTYDAVGNRTDSGADIDLDGNIMAAFDGYAFVHDDEGRTLTKTKSGFAQTYHWNARSQLDSVTTIDSGDTTVVHYTYDGAGRRITRDGPGGFEEYLYDGANIIAVLDDEADVVTRIMYWPGIDAPHSVTDDAEETYYYARDYVGSVTGLMDLSGAPAIENRYRYDAWGRSTGTVTEGTHNLFRFKSRVFDPDTELYDFRSRWYDPETGRFVSQDPIGLAGGLNAYRFVSNNPVSGWDPFGLQDQEKVVDDGCTFTDNPRGPGVLPPLRVCVTGTRVDPFGGNDNFSGENLGPPPIYSSGKSGGRGGTGGGGTSAPAQTIHGELGKQCATDAILLGIEAALDITGFGALDAVSIARRGPVRSTLEAAQLAVGGSVGVAQAGIQIGSTAAGKPTLGTNFADLGRRSGNSVLYGVGLVVEFGRAVPGAGTIIQLVGTSISCGSAAYAAASDYLAVP